MDAHVGLFPTPLGYEVIDPSANPFYSHSYIFNFGLPLKHAGILTTSHITPLLDFYLGVDTGVNTTFGCCNADDNGQVAGIIGVGLNMMGGNLTVLALSHIGPENASRTFASLINPDTGVPFGGKAANGYMRYYNNVVRDLEGERRADPDNRGQLGPRRFRRLLLERQTQCRKRVRRRAIRVLYAERHRDVQCASRSLSGRQRLFRHRLPEQCRPDEQQLRRWRVGPAGATSVGTGKATTYGEITIGLTFKPSLPAPITGLLIRPELRVDDALSGGHPFGSNMNASSQVTIASDFVLTF